MACFKENKESQIFMLDRINETVEMAVKLSNDEYIQNILKQTNEMYKFINTLKNEVKTLAQSNGELKGKLDGVQTNFELQLNERAMSMGKEMEEMKKELESVMQSRAQLEEEVQVSKRELMTVEKEMKNQEMNETQRNLEIERLRKQLIEFESCGKREGEELVSLRVKFEGKEKEVEGLGMKVGQLEKEVRRLGFEKKEMESEFRRKEKAFEEEKKQIAEKVENIQNNYKVQTDNSVFKNRISELEGDKDRLRAELQQKNMKIDDHEFMITQLESTIDNFKSELSEMTKKMSDERRSKHESEIMMIELKDKHSEMMLKKTALQDDFEKTTQEVTHSHLTSLVDVHQKSARSQRERPQNGTQKGCHFGTRIRAA
jgi:chromosome segregation ATPase